MIGDLHVSFTIPKIIFWGMGLVAIIEFAIFYGLWLTYTYRKRTWYFAKRKDCK